MNHALRNDIVQLIRRWKDEGDALHAEQKRWPMNHVHYRIYQAQINLLNANLVEIMAIFRKHDGMDQTETRLNDALVELERLRGKASGK